MDDNGLQTNPKRETYFIHNSHLPPPSTIFEILAKKISYRDIYLYIVPVIDYQNDIWRQMRTTRSNIATYRRVTMAKMVVPSSWFLLLLLLLLVLSANKVPIVTSSSPSETSNNNDNHVDNHDECDHENADRNNNLVCINHPRDHDGTETSSTFHNEPRKVDETDWNHDASTGISLSYRRHCIQALQERHAHLCWHKHSTFLDHLISVHDILQRWNQKITIATTTAHTTTNGSTNRTIADTMIPRIGLFHSAYSNSYVNLALFNVTTERHVVQQLIGPSAEEYVYIFCSIDRQDVVVNTLLRQHFIRPEGLTVPHLRNPNETIYLSPRTLYILLIFTMADIADQYFDWQDMLFGGGNTEGSMILPGYDANINDRHNTKALWPGLSRPGLWMSYVSQLGSVARTYHRHHHNNNNNNTSSNPSRIAQIDDNVSIRPPVFESGTQTISPHDEVIARDLYWSVIDGTIRDETEIIVTLQTCIERNPFIFEPLVLLSQVYAHANDYNRTIVYAHRAMELQEQWGIAWDKRMSFAAWVAWTKVLWQRAHQSLPWPTNAWEVNNLGYVHP